MGSGSGYDDGETEAPADSDSDSDGGDKGSGQPGLSGERVPCRAVLALVMGVAAAGFLL